MCWNSAGISMAPQPIRQPAGAKPVEFFQKHTKEKPYYSYLDSCETFWHLPFDTLLWLSCGSKDVLLYVHVHPIAYVQMYNWCCKKSTNFWSALDPHLQLNFYKNSQFHTQLFIRSYCRKSNNLKQNWLKLCHFSCSMSNTKTWKIYSVSSILLG